MHLTAARARGPAVQGHRWSPARAGPRRWRRCTTCATDPRGFRAETAFDSASAAAEVTILGALLRQSMEQHRALTAHEVELTTAITTKSDNDATNALWHQIGDAGIHFLTLAGMEDTVPGPKGYWGTPRSRPRTSSRLLRLLTSDNSVRPGRAYLRPPAHEPGCPRAASGERPPGPPRRRPFRSSTRGWLPRDTHGWRVHSVGVFTGGGHDYADWSCSPRTPGPRPTASRPSRAPPMP